MDGTKELIPKNIITVDEELDEFSTRPVANKTLFYKFKASGLPPVTADDNGKFLCVVSGYWTATIVPQASGNEF